jgi:hypothetical protein
MYGGGVSWKTVACPAWAWPGTCLAFLGRQEKNPERPTPCPVEFPGPAVGEGTCYRMGRKGDEPPRFYPAKCESWAQPGTCTEETKPLPSCPDNLVRAEPTQPPAAGSGSEASGGKPKAGPGDQPKAGPGGETVPDANGEGHPDTREFNAAIARLQEALTPVVTGLAGIGVLLGAGLLAIGQQGGLRIAGISATAGGVLLLGQGLIQVFSPT